MRLRVLGSAAGGGLPQWNCACDNCRAVRNGSPSIRARTQDGLALEAAPGVWFLINASPDIHRQIRATPALEPVAMGNPVGVPQTPPVAMGNPVAVPQTPPVAMGNPVGVPQTPPRRASPIHGVILTNGDLDHTLGLFSLRENTPLALYATAGVRHGLVDGNTMFRTLQRFETQTTWHRLVADEAVELVGPSGPTGVRVTAVPLPGKVPKHLEGLAPASPEDNVGLWIRDARGRTIVVATAAGAAGPWVTKVNGADACFIDGTFWSSDELPRLGLGTARAEDMAHLPIGGAGGSLEALAGLTVGRKVFTHINNTNPILVDGSPERLAVQAAGWEVAEDGLEIDL